MATLAKEHGLRQTLGPGFVKEKIIPKLRAAVQSSEGRLKSFYLWPEFDPTANEANGQQGRKGREGRYPTRRGGY